MFQSFLYSFLSDLNQPTSAGCRIPKFKKIELVLERFLYLNIPVKRGGMYKNSQFKSDRAVGNS